MDHDILRLLAAVAAAALLLGIIGFLWLTTIVVWGERRTKGLAYFGLSPGGRKRYRRNLLFHARILAPMIRLMAHASRFSFEKASFGYLGVLGPKGTCSPESFRSGSEYKPSPADVFIVTQMRSGTTWMQHLVYEILMRGEGELVETGRTLNAVSPWLESVIGVPVEDAPTVGAERPSRVIKTHFPVSLCPRSMESKYVYVARHPASCFASCVDFLAENLGPAAPSLDAVERWFCSESMWWGSWPSHVDGWWSRSLQEGSVLFVRYEAMLESLPEVVAEIAAFLGVAPLSETEMRLVCGKGSFGYMKQHKEVFEMYPPHVLAPDSSYFARGTSDRHRDVPDVVRRRIMSWCRGELEDGRFPLDRFYSDRDGGADGGSARPRTLRHRTASEPQT